MRINRSVIHSNGKKVYNAFGAQGLNFIASERVLLRANRISFRFLLRTTPSNVFGSVGGELERGDNCVVAAISNMQRNALSFFIFRNKI